MWLCNGRSSSCYYFNFPNFLNPLFIFLRPQLPKINQNASSISRILWVIGSGSFQKSSACAGAFKMITGTLVASKASFLFAWKYFVYMTCASANNFLNIKNAHIFLGIFHRSLHFCLKILFYCHMWDLYLRYFWNYLYISGIVYYGHQQDFCFFTFKMDKHSWRIVCCFIISCLTLVITSIR